MYRRKYLQDVSTCIYKRKRSLWVGKVREGMMVEMWEDQVVAKTPERAGNTVLKGAGNDTSPWGLRKCLEKFRVITKNG